MEIERGREKRKAAWCTLHSSPEFSCLPLLPLKAPVKTADPHVTGPQFLCPVMGL